MTLSALDEEAQAIGLRKAQGVAEAKAICPSLDIRDADIQADQRLLSGLADWCDRYTPLVALDGADGLMLDITGCTHLFGGEQAMVDEVLGRLLLLGFEVRGAVASTPGLAWGAARFSGATVIAEGQPESVLQPLPVAALRLPVETVADLAKVGLKRAGELLAIPRASLTKRFGRLVLLRLDQALGAVDEPITPRRPVALLSAERQLPEPIRDHEMILDLAGQLAVPIKTKLEEREEGGRLFELLLFRVDGQVFRIEVGTSAPLRATARIAALFAERLQAVHDDLDAGFGFELVRLNVLHSEPFRAVEARFADAGEMEDPLPAFIDQVVARLGRECLKLPVILARHWPERACQMVVLADGVPVAAEVPQAVRGERPIRLLVHPEAVEVTAEIPHGPPASFRWRRVRHRVSRAEGPERLTPEWWIDGEEAKARDYFRIEDTIGRRFWLYRQGLYERGDAPSWFIQGIFA